EHPVPGPLARRRILDRKEHSAAPFPAEPATLSETAEGEQQWRRDADRLVGWQQADHHGRDTHREQRRYQAGLPSDAVAAVPEQRRPDRACEEGDREGCE